MVLKAVMGITLTLLMLNAVLSFTPPIQGFESSFKVSNHYDVRLAPDLSTYLSEFVSAFSSSPNYYETSEYLIGSVAVGVVFLESNGTTDPQTENWTPTEESRVVSEIQIALNWWRNQNPSASVSFTLLINYSVPTSYEPINRGSTDEGLWISEAMTYLGYPGTFYFTQTRDYVNDLRRNSGTNWAFAMFIVDSSNDADGSFSDGYFAYAYLGGPFLVMTYDNDGWGIGNMDRVAAHEMGHIFYATDEYNGITENSGYLNVSDIENSGCLMNDATFQLSSGTRGQVGWRDSDGDNLQDIVDTFPETFLNPYSPDPTTNPNLIYIGTVAEIPYPNNNPYGTSRDITTNTITKVEYRIDGGPWQNAIPSDGAFDDAQESFSFTTILLSPGTYMIETRGTNSVGNVETSYGIDIVTLLPPVRRVPRDYPTIQAAIDAAASGDTILVASGTYYENVVVDRSISLIGEDKYTTIIDGGGTPFESVVTITANDFVVNGFTIRNGGSFAYGIYLESANNGEITNNIVTNNEEDGIYLLFSENNIISGNRIISNGFNGIMVEYSTNNIISGNNVSSNGYCGIYLSADFNTLSRNSISSNGEHGIRMVGNCHIVSSNIVSNNVEAGILLDSSSNIFSGNNISLNGYGIYFYPVSGPVINNTLFYNNFVDNTVQVYLATPSYDNMWDAGYPCGNYWSNYTGTDLFSGPYQGEPGSDGIVDEPYVIDANNRDNYPLMNPWIPPDIAVMKVTPSKTIIGQGFTLRINVTVQNQGNKMEDFDIAVYANATLIASQTVTLSSRNSTTITFTWTTTGFVKGVYTITVIATPAIGEIDIADNPLVGGTVRINMVADLALDFGVVNIVDIVYVAIHFDAKKGEPRYEPNADINDDGTINIADIVMAALHFDERDS